MHNIQWTVGRHRGDARARLVASASSAADGSARDNRVGLAPGDACWTSTSIRDAFSACIMMIAHVLPGPLHRPQDLAVVAVEQPGYAMNSLKLLIPSSATSWSMALSESSPPRPRIMWNA